MKDHDPSSSGTFRDKTRRERTKVRRRLKVLRDHLKELEAVLSPILVEHSTDDWLQRLQEAGHPARTRFRFLRSR